LNPVALNENEKLKAYRLIEKAGRTCYKSEPKGAPERFVRKLVEHGHEAMLEHYSITVRFVTDRGVANEIVRHRLASFAQVSTRYVDYGTDDIAFIRPVDIPAGSLGSRYWIQACQCSEYAYQQMRLLGLPPEECRSVLPLCTATELVMTANLREWRHFIALRADGVTGKPHPDMERLARMLKRELAEWMPEVFAAGDSVVIAVKEEEQ